MICSDVFAGNVTKTECRKRPWPRTFLTRTTRPSFRAEFKAGDDGKTAVCMTRWVDTRGEKCPWSEITTATVAAQGARAGSLAEKRSHRQECTRFAPAVPLHVSCKPSAGNEVHSDEKEFRMFRRHVIVTSSVALAFALAGVFSLGMSAPAPAEDTLPAVQLVGHDSRITTPRFVLVRDQPAWDALWAEHTGAALKEGAMGRHAAPKIDFSRFMVVGMFGGAVTNTDGEVAQSITVTDDQVRVRYESSTFQTSSFGGNGDPGVNTSPFGLWVIQASKLPVVIEEGRRGLKDSPVSWKEVKRFNAK